ncbi:hypothetical protein BC629DRAFT_1443562 [Irpex lacteus]|nr:hypothetical protein BC629DRAFT_1443562 [Irpex lacteus]
MAEPSSPLSSLRSSSPAQAIPTTPPQPRKYTDEELAPFLGKVRRAQSATDYLPPLPALFGFQDPHGSTEPGVSTLPAAADPQTVVSSADSDSETESPELAGNDDGSPTLDDDKNKWTYVASVANEVFTILDNRGVSWGTLVEYLADASTKQGTRRWYGFFKSGPQVRRVLTYWLSSRNGGRHTLREWAVGYVSKLVDKEANSVTNSGLLKSRNKNVDSSFVLLLQRLCLVMAGVIQAFCTIHRQTKSKNEHSKKKRRTRMLATFLDLLGQRSQQNSLSKHLFGLYLFATGTQWQTIAVLSSWRVCSSYSTLAGTQVSAISTDEPSSRHAPVDSETNPEVAPTPTTSAMTSDTPPAVEDFDGMEVDEEETQGKDTVSESEASMSSDSNSDRDEPEFIRLEYESGSDHDVHMSIDVPGKATPLHIGMVLDDLGEPFPARSEDEDMMVDSEEEVQGRRAALLAENDGISVSKQTTTHKPAISQDAINPSVTATLGCTHGKKTEGLVRRLSKACCHAAQQAAQSHDVAHVYDNINFMFKAAQQIVGRKDSQENGTCATAIRLINASLDDMRTADLVSNMKQASALDMKDVLLFDTEAAEYRSLLIHTIIRVIVTHGGSSFEKFQEHVNASLPVTAEQIPVHKTEYYPLPAMEIDESSVVGNADVVEAISQLLAYDLESPEYLRTVRIYCSDQLSMARVRTVAHNRVGHDAPQQAHVNIVQVPGLFHAQMHVVSSCLEAHWGLPGAGARDPGSLGFHNTIIDRKPIVLSSPPPYRTCRDLIFVSLYARILHRLELVSGIKVDDYAASMTFASETLKGHAEEIYEHFASSEVVDDLRHGTPSLQEIDGESDSGRVLLSFKTLSAFYRGSGHTKYAYETLVTLHNTIHVWPAPPSLRIGLSTPRVARMGLSQLICYKGQERTVEPPNTIRGKAGSMRGRDDAMRSSGMERCRDLCDRSPTGASSGHDCEERDRSFETRGRAGVAATVDIEDATSTLNSNQSTFTGMRETDEDASTAAFPIARVILLCLLVVSRSTPALYENKRTRPSHGTYYSPIVFHLSCHSYPRPTLLILLPHVRANHDHHAPFFYVTTRSQ